MTALIAASGGARFGGALVAVVVLCGCSAAPKESAAPFRSPSHDYPLPPVQTSDGEVVGVDRQAPGDKLRTSPAVGSGGPSPAAGAVVPESEAHGHPSPCDEIGLKDENGKSQCTKTKTPAPVAPRGK